MIENTESQEMYLTTIYALQKKNGTVRSVDVAAERGYSKASVHNAMDRLADFGYIKFYQGKITLTKCGLEKVKNIEQKHKTLVSALKLIGASDDSAKKMLVVWNTLLQTMWQLFCNFMSSNGLRSRKI